MSNFLAIATVTETLKQMLQASVQQDVTGANVTALRPDSTNTNLPNPGVNLYLYQVSPNAAWRNNDLPTRRASGELLQRPQVALNLHYLLTFYGKESDLEPQRLLGSVVRTLQARPLLNRQQIQAAISSSSFLANSNLDDEVERVKFTPLPLSLEELSKIWSVLFQTIHTLSLVYEGSVVLIESEDRPQQALPVRDRNLYVIPFRQPSIQRVQSKEGVNDLIVSNSTLLIEGSQLQGEVTRVLINGEEVTTQEEDVSDTQISLSLASLPSAIVLRAGVQAIQVVQLQLMGTPPQEHRGFESNVAAFVLHPSITVSLADVTCTTPTPQNPISRCSATITVNFVPSVGGNQRVILLLNEFNPPSTRSSLAYSFDAPVNNGITETAAIAFTVTQVVRSSYLVRVQVDGAASLLQVDTNEMSPTFNQYLNPQVTF